MTTQKTRFVLEREKREQEVVDYFNSLRFADIPYGEAETLTMKKFNIYSRVTIWAIRKRVKARQL